MARLGDDPATARRTLQAMWRCRRFEEAVDDLFARGLMHGTMHLSIGQEASATGTCFALRDDDAITSTHRGHSHCIAKGADLERMMAELLAKETGYCRGRGGSMHLADVATGNLGANGIVGGGPPMNCGVGLSAKVRGTDQVGVSFTGDGGSNQGTFLESLNLAAVWHLPCVFVVENNGYAESTSDRFHASGVDIAKRADGFGMPGVVVDGHDFFAVHEAAGAAIERARAGGGPSLLECKVNRYYGHFEGDQGLYRTAEQLEDLKTNNDPLHVFRTKRPKCITDAELDAIDQANTDLIDECVAQARAAEWPDAAAVLDDVYVAY